MKMRILYLHGFASSPRSAKAGWFSERFARSGRHLEVLDLERGGFENLTLAAEFEVLAQAACGEPVALIGSSLGGYLAALYAARHPEVVRLVALAPAFDFAARFRRRLGEAVVDDWRRAGSREFFHFGREQTLPLLYRFLDDAARWEPYPQVPQPALIVHGIADDVVPVEVSREFARRNPHARLLEVDSDHALTGALEWIWPPVEEFLAQANTA